jgi:hypothetical protein
MSPFSDYTAGVLTYGILVTLLVVLLVGGGILLVNLGMLSRRDQDRVGRRTPGDLEVLKHELWPDEKEGVTKPIPAERPGRNRRLRSQNGRMVIEHSEANSRRRA